MSKKHISLLVWFKLLTNQLFVSGKTWLGVDDNEKKQETPKSEDCDNPFPFRPWGRMADGIRLDNTCTIDNLLLMMHLLMTSNDSIKKLVQHNGDIGKILIEVSDMFNKQQWAMGKLHWVRQTVSNLIADGEVDLYGTEHYFFVRHLAPFQEHTTNSVCSNSTCPERSIARTSGEILLRCFLITFILLHWVYFLSTFRLLSNINAI